MPASALNYVGNVTPNTMAKAREILTKVEEVGHRIHVIWGYSATSRPEHSSGRALDFMCTRAAGDWIADYIWRNRSRLSLKWQIWRQRIISIQRASEGWRWMTDRGSITQNHYDHVHVWFDDGYSYPSEPLKPVGSTVKDALWTGQQLVKHGFDRHYRIGPSSSWGPADEANLREFQMIIMGRYNNLGTLDDETKRALERPLFISSVRHAVDYHTPIDVRLLKMAALKLGVAPHDAQRSPAWWNDDLSRSSDPTKDVGRWYWESQIEYQIKINNEPDPPLGPKQWALMGSQSKLFRGIA